MRDTSIVFYSGAEVPRNQLDAPIFNSYQEQQEYFHSRSGQYKWTDDVNRWQLNNLQFTRVSEKVVQINTGAVTYAQLKRCNYMAIRNAQDERWYYSFVDNVEYVSESCTNVTFDIDVIQTFMFNGEFSAPFSSAKQAYVERCHSATDEVGDNLADEGSTPAKLIKQNVQKVGSNMTTSYVYVDTWTTKALTNLATLDARFVRQYGNTLYLGWAHGQGANPIYTVNTYADLIDRLNRLDNDGIISIQCVPRLCAGTFVEGHEIKDDTVPDVAQLEDIDDYKKHTVEDVSIDAVNIDTDDMDGYVPKNNKLWTSLGCEIVVQTNDGQRIILSPEYLNIRTNEEDERIIVLSGKITGTMVGTASLIFRPTNYAGLGANASPFNADFEKTLVLTGYPECVWTRNETASWKVQNAESFSLKTIASGITNAVLLSAMASTGNALGTAYATARLTNGLIDSGSEYIKAQNKPDSVGGVPSCDANDYNHDQKMFFCYYKTLNANDAKILDDYLSRNGYAQNRVLNVSEQLHNRMNWDFIKTNGITFDDEYSGFNGNYKKQLASIFDRGIRFWWYKNHNLSVGNYGSMTNPITPSN